NLPWRISTSYFNNQLSANLRVEGYHHLDGTDSSGNAVMDKDRPYNRLPQLSIEYLAPTERWGGDLTNFRLGATHNTAYFKKSIKDGSDTEKSGVRMYNQLFASRPFLHSWGYITPKVAITNLLMSYDEDSLAGQNLSKEDGRFSVTLPSFSLDTGVYLQKQGAPFGLTDATGGYQILSPRLKYVYSPYKNQSDMPIFDTSVASISYDQLLADTWFLGYDRLADLHAITPALNYRYIDSQGLTRIDASIAEQYYLDDVNVSINNTTFTDSSSGLAWQASIQPKQDFWLDAQGSFTQNYALDTLVLAARYQPKANTLFNVGVIERKQNDALGQLALSAYTASALFPINNKWQVVAQGQYDVNRNLFMDALFGINYEDCCLGMSIYARHYRNELYPEQEPNRAIMAEVRLTGLAGKGRLNRLLSERILGFESIRNTWQGNR
ncbi:MAG: LPS-assembly protein LptD, partial [Moraxella sp.]|nr:LPS-assembly protein LptD [Moraxella sp.]